MGGGYCNQSSFAKGQFLIDGRSKKKKERGFSDSNIRRDSILLYLHVHGWILIPWINKRMDAKIKSIFSWIKFVFHREIYGRGYWHE